MVRPIEMDDAMEGADPALTPAVRRFTRTIDVLDRHGVPWSCRARQVRPTDYAEFDYVFAMVSLWRTRSDRSRASQATMIGNWAELTATLLSRRHSQDKNNLSNLERQQRKGSKAQGRVFSLLVSPRSLTLSAAP